MSVSVRPHRDIQKKTEVFCWISHTITSKKESSESFLVCAAPLYEKETCFVKQQVKEKGISNFISYFWGRSVGEWKDGAQRFSASESTSV